MLPNRTNPTLTLVTRNPSATTYLLRPDGWRVRRPALPRVLQVGARLSWAVLVGCGVPAGPDDAGTVEPHVVETPDAYVPPRPSAPFRSVTAGYTYCATTTNDELWCWSGSDAPQRFAAATAEVDCARAGCCALSVEGAVSCWGGTGLISEDLSSAARPTLLSIPPAIAVRVGGHHACALLSTTEMMCWGANFAGQLGHGPTEHRPGGFSPERVPSLRATTIGLGYLSTYALQTDGTVLGWGSNLAGELGVPAPLETTSPVPTSDLEGAAISVDGSDETSASGSLFACAVLADGRVSCWGSNHSGELGGGSPDDVGPVIVGGLSNVVQVSVGYQTAVARLAGGEVYQWGSFNGGSSTPALVGAVDAAVDVAAGDGTACAVTVEGHVVCWGRNPGDYGPSP